MEKVMILATPAEIAEGLRRFLADNPSPEPTPEFDSDRMTAAEGSRFAGVSYRTFCEWINADKIPVHGQGRTRFLLKSELVEALKKMK